MPGNVQKEYFLGLKLVNYNKILIFYKIVRHKLFDHKMCFYYLDNLFI